MLRIIPIPAFNDNYIWLILNPDNKQAAVVDPGDAEPVLNYCAQNEINIIAILITHHHHDHIGGIDKLFNTYHPHVYGPKNENIPHCNQPVSEGSRVTLSELELCLDVIDIPGHTKGHIAYIGNDWLFSGDTLFAGGCGRIFEGTPQQMLHSLQKLSSLKPNTKIFCAHEYTLNNLKFALLLDPNNQALQQRISEVIELRNKNEPSLPSRIELELKTNPFLRTNDNAIRQAAERYSGQKLFSELDIFTAIRQQKDNY